MYLLPSSSSSSLVNEYTMLYRAGSNSHVVCIKTCAPHGYWLMTTANQIHFAVLVSTLYIYQLIKQTTMITIDRFRTFTKMSIILFVNLFFIVSNTRPSRDHFVNNTYVTCTFYTRFIISRLYYLLRSRFIFYTSI